MPIKSSTDEELRAQKWECLTNRERELLHLLAEGANNKAISNYLRISIKTVEFHVSNILKKFEMNSRAEVIVWVLKHSPDTPGNTKD